MTKNNRFKKEVRAYQNAFNVTYMQALAKVSEHYIVTPDMEELVEHLLNEKIYFWSARPRTAKSGATLLTGATGSGKSFLQHYLAKEAVEKHFLRIIHESRDQEIEKIILPGLGLDEPVPGSFIINLNPKYNPGAPNWSEEYLIRQVLRMRTDILTIPEVNASTISLYDASLEAIDAGQGLLATYHSTNPYTVLDNFYSQWEEYFTSLEGEVDDSTLKLREKGNIGSHLSTIVDVNRVVVNNKSLVVASKYDVTPALVEAWLKGELKDYLDSQGFIPAAEKKKSILESLKK